MRYWKRFWKNMIKTLQYNYDIIGKKSEYSQNYFNTFFCLPELLSFDMLVAQT